MVKKLDSVNSIYLFNLAEDAETLIAGMRDKGARRAEIIEDIGLADHDLFYGSDNRLLISSVRIPKEFLSYVMELMRYRNLTNLSPRSARASLCRAITEDKSFYNRLKETIRNCPKPPTVSAYALTEGYINLIRRLRQEGLVFRTPDMPKDARLWTRDYFGSKSGFRQFVNSHFPKNHLIKLPTGLICSNPREAARIAAHIYLNNPGVVLKINRGHAGAGLLIFPKGKLPGQYEKIYQAIFKILAKNPYWSTEPVVVENFIQVDYYIGGGSPNIELTINPKGKVTTLYTCGMRINKNGVFLGVEAGRGVFNNKVDRELQKIGKKVGYTYSQYGYRGSFEVDLVIDRKGNLYCTESNLRKTGGSFIYSLGVRLFGQNFLKDYYVLSRNLYFNKNLAKHNFLSLSEKLRDLLLIPGVRDHGLVITGVSLLKTGRLGYVIFADSKGKAVKIEQRMNSLLSH